MGLRILHDTRSSDTSTTAALYDSCSDWAFGPVFQSDDQHDADERAEAFLRWLKADPRTLDEPDLASAYSRWLAQEPEQWAAEKAAAEAAELEE